MTALISVTLLAIPLLQEAFTPNGPRFSFSRPQFNPGAFTVEAKNIGNTPATLDHAVVSIPQKSAGQPYIYILQATGDEASHRIGQGDTVRLTFSFDRENYGMPQVNDDDVGCSIEVFDSVRSISCSEVRYLASNPPEKVGSDAELPSEGPAPLDETTAWRRITQ